MNCWKFSMRYQWMSKIDLGTYKPCREGRHSLFISEENKCKHIGDNKHKSYVRQYKFDGEVIPKHEQISRCDYILLNDTNPAAYYIELKGSDIKKAIQQVETSYAMCHDFLSNYKAFFRIIYHSGTMDVRSRAANNWLLKRKGTAIIKSKEYKDTLL